VNPGYLPIWIDGVLTAFDHLANSLHKRFAFEERMWRIRRVFGWHPEDLKRFAPATT